MKSNASRIPAAVPAIAASLTWLFASPLSAQNTTAVAVKGGAASGTGGVFTTLGRPIMNANGRVAFSGKVVGPGISSLNNSGIWAEDANGDQQLIVRSGHDAPDSAGGTTGLTFTKFGEMVFNDNGAVAFLGTIRGIATAGGTSFTLAETTGMWNRYVVTWFSGDSTSATLAIGDFTIPSDGNDFVLDDISFKSLTSGELVLNGDFSQGNEELSSAYQYRTTAFGPGGYTVGTNPTPYNGAWASFGDHTTGSGQMMIVDGGAAGSLVWGETVEVTPDTQYEFSFWAASTFSLHPANLIAGINADLAAGPVTAGDDTGLWSNTGGTLHLVAREGRQAPGCPNGVAFGKFMQFGLPNQGGVVLYAKLKGAEITSANDCGIWAVDTDGTLRLIAREGDTQPATGKQIKVITFLPAVATVTGQTRNFSQATGDLIYSASFTDGSIGIFKVTFP